MSIDEKFQPFYEKMKAEKLGPAAIASFKHCFTELVSGKTGMITESDIKPAKNIPSLEDNIKNKYEFDSSLLNKVVQIKLNGGLGTSMGLNQAKSLLNIKDSDTFLDLTACQIQSFRQKFNSDLKFMLLNSFNTSEDTINFLSKKYEWMNKKKTSDNSSESFIELIQNKVPKINKSDLTPAHWPANKNLEWCPPGHGDIYTALYESGQLEKLVSEGVIYAFISNSDNLGATLDTDLLSYFANNDIPFLMECCSRTESDKKGGHLAVRASDNHLILRESAQCPKEDLSSFEDITLHNYFNTNNIWIRLDRLLELLRKYEQQNEEKGSGFLPLPCIFNGKTVDPQQDSSPAVWQLETAMGAAIELFDGAQAVCVPRTRFAPVKKCSDLLLLRSDAYEVRPSDSVLVLSEKSSNRHPGKISPAPIIALDDKKYKLVQSLDMATRHGVPSLALCDKLTVSGMVWFSSENIIKGTVQIINKSSEPRVLPPGTYENTTIDLTESLSTFPLTSSIVSTTPYTDQKPGTSGLRKATRTFMKENYLENFVQATFNALKSEGIDVTKSGLLIGGDGRFYNSEAIPIITKIAVANGVSEIYIGQNGLLSTPAASAIIREYNKETQKIFGAFLLTASHNPGGIDADFGIKFNAANGGPAPEGLTNLIYQHTLILSNYLICKDLPEINVDEIKENKIFTSCQNFFITINVINSTLIYCNLLESIFNMSLIKKLLKKKNFTLVYDCMYGVQGPYAREIFLNYFNLDSSCLLNSVPSPDFNGNHADPNLTYARDLCNIMGVDEKGNPIKSTASVTPTFGAACDGDADRNMILGSNFFVSPSDSLAILAAHAHIIPYFSSKGGLKTVARSMPTSGAVDRVAKKLGLNLFETPTGWKFFGNVMDAHIINPQGGSLGPVICGEESFGTGSDHVREKDGLWAVLFWLNILAHYNVKEGEEETEEKELVTVKDIVLNHWKTYGRNYYCRYDYEGVDSAKANEVMDHLRSQFSTLPGKVYGSYTISTVDEFKYIDPIDHSVSLKQGIRILFSDSSRIIFRLSGTAGSGATIRVYMEKYDENNIELPSGEALEELISIAHEISDLKRITGFNSPTVIT